MRRFCIGYQSEGTVAAASAQQQRDPLDDYIPSWNVSSVTTMADMFESSGLSDCNNAAIHSSFNAQTPSVWMSAGGCRHRCGRRGAREAQDAAPEQPKCYGENSKDLRV